MNDRRRAAAHVFVDDLVAPELTNDDAHHLQRVLRLRDGERVTASDGRGNWRACRIDGSGLVVDGEIESESVTMPVAVLFALSKGDKPEIVVQKLTELGVSRIVPFVAERSVVRWDDEKSQRNVDRLRKVAREAAMQSRQVRLPIVDDVRPTLSEAIDAVGGAVLAEPGGSPIGGSVRSVAVGPEGGFTPSELSGRDTVALPGGILRAETAAVVAGALLIASRS